ncbi:MAG: hypothetical protein FJ387_05510 [Verrucomicrobia bacterium]|nr:hypothetical protein [Verrucomicrobiota bacterium]
MKGLRTGQASRWLSGLIAAVGLGASVALAASAESVPGEPVPAAEAAVAEPAAEASTPVPPANPYQSIISRNPFGLREPPPPAPPQPPPQPQVAPSALKLTGITTLLTGKRAMFVLQEPGKPQAVNSDLLREGEKDTTISDLEVLQIDELARVVRVRFSGKELALNFDENGIAPPTGPAPAPPGQPAVIRPGQPGVPQVPGQVRPTVTTASFQPGRPTFQVASGSSGDSNPSGLRSIPTRPSRLGVVGGGVASTPQTDVLAVPTLPPEVQHSLMREQQALANQAGVPFPPVPPMPGEAQVPTLPQFPDAQVPQLPGYPPNIPAPPGFVPPGLPGN